MKVVIRKNPVERGSATLDDLRGLAAAGRLYAVIDACDTPGVPQKASELGQRRAVSLYRGTAEEMYWAIAPYLFAVDGELLDWIVAELWPEPWGIFAVADAGVDDVRRHFRRFLLVQSPEGEQWYFRFYDPRVLPTFIRHSTAEELRELFGALRAFIIPGPGSQVLEIVSLAPTAAAPSKIRIRLHRPD